MPNNLFYGASPHIFKLANELRRNMTETEKLLWDKLRKNQLEGYRFKPQHPIFTYIVDFYCHKARLVIEIDGEYHSDVEIVKYDLDREEIMKEFGLIILRFSNEDILFNMEYVVNRIRECLSFRNL